MAKPPPNRNPRYVLIEAAAQETSSQVFSLVSIATIAIAELECLQKTQEDLKAQVVRLEVEAEEHAELRKEYDGKISEQKQRMLELTSALTYRDKELEEKGRSCWRSSESLTRHREGEQRSKGNSREDDVCIRRGDPEKYEACCCDGFGSRSCL